jgi:DNA-binding LytR/AlgR family response regulator
MITALIAEQDATTASLLRRALSATGQVQVVAVAATGEECLDLLSEHEPDALLLGSVSGAPVSLELAQVVAGWDCPPLLAFVTCDTRHAAEAFDLGAVDYVAVPPGAKAFGARVALMVVRLAGARAAAVPPMPDAPARAPAQPAASPLTVVRKFAVKDYTEGTVRLISTDSLICAQRADRRVVLRTPTRDYPTYHSIESLARRLAPAGFFRASAGTLINLEHVEHLIPNGDGSYDVLLRAGGQTIQATVSRSRARELLTLLDPV